MCLFPRWVVRTLQAVATVLFVLNLYQGRMITGLTYFWTGLSVTSMSAFSSHAKSHPKPGMESDIKRFVAALPSAHVELLAVSDLSSPSPVHGTANFRGTQSEASIAQGNRPS